MIPPRKLEAFRPLCSISRFHLGKIETLLITVNPINFTPSPDPSSLTQYGEVGRMLDTKAGKPLHDAQLQLILYPRNMP